MRVLRPGNPLYVGLNLTTRCNLRCAYCYMQPLSNELMTKAGFRRVLGQLEDSQVFMVCVAGGEPFTHPDVVEFLRDLTARIPQTVVLTNGTAMGARHFSAIDEIARSGKRLAVQVSLDAVDSSVNRLTRGASDVVLRNIATLSELGVRLTVAMVVTSQNVDSLLSSIVRLSAFTPYFHLMSVQAPRAARDAIAELEVDPERLVALWDEVEDLASQRGLFVSSPKTAMQGRGSACGAPCSAAFSYVVVDPNLDVRPCDHLTDVVLGNLASDTLEKIWNSSPIVPVLHGSPVPFCHRPEASGGWGAGVPGP